MAGSTTPFPILAARCEFDMGPETGQIGQPIFLIL